MEGRIRRENVKERVEKNKVKDRETAVK